VFCYSIMIRFYAQKSKGVDLFTQFNSKEKNE